MNKVLLLTMITLCVIGFFCVPSALYDGCSYIDRLTYQFNHYGVLHITANLYVLLRLYKARWLYLPRHSVLFAYGVSCLAPSSSTPTVGISGVLFALLGIILPQAREKRKYVAYIIALSLIGYFAGTTNVPLHLFCFTLGILYGFAMTPTDKTIRD